MVTYPKPSLQNKTKPSLNAVASILVSALS